MRKCNCEKLRDRLIQVPLVGQSAVFVFKDSNIFYAFNTNCFLSKEEIMKSDFVTKIDYCPFCGGKLNG